MSADIVFEPFMIDLHKPQTEFGSAKQPKFAIKFLFSIIWHNFKIKRYHFYFYIKMAQNEKNICDSTYEQLCELIIDIKTQAEYNKYDSNIDNYDAKPEPVMLSKVLMTGIKK